MKNKFKWALNNWNITIFLLMVFLYIVYAIAFELIGTWITWEDFSDSWYWLYIFSLPFFFFIHLVAALNKKKHGWKLLLASIFIWFFVQGMTVGQGV